MNELMCQEWKVQVGSAMCSIACLEAIDRIIAGLFVHTCHNKTSRLFLSRVLRLKLTRLMSK